MITIVSQLALKKAGALAFILVTLLGSGSAQGTGGGSSTSQRAQQVQLSGRSQSGATVSAQQSAAQSGGSSSVNTVNSVVQIQGSYQGSVPAPASGNGPAALTLSEALRMGLQYNLGGISSNSTLQQLRGLRLAALSEMLPNIYGTISETGAKTDLQSLGLSNGTFGGGISLPTVVGPYHYYSAQANVSEQFSLTSIFNLRSANAAQQAGSLDAHDARELIILGVGGSYLRVLATQALVASQEAQVKYAETSYQQAQAQYQAGTKAVIEANRSLVELQTQRQRLTSQRADLTKQKMTLARLIGISPGRDLSLAETLPADPPPLPDVDQAIRIASDHRYDLRAAAFQLKAAEDARRASRSEYLPSASVNGYYGGQGVNPDKGAGVFQASASINIPIWSSGRTRADVEQADAAITQRRAEYADQRGVVENDVRTALIDLKVAIEQVQVAESNRKLALSTLQQSQDRFAAGVTTSVEVVQSEESLASAEHDYINSLFSLNLGQISLARALGQAETTIPTMLKGQ
jgi:outer membrane protein TolC